MQSTHEQQWMKHVLRNNVKVKGNPDGDDQGVLRTWIVRTSLAQTRVIDCDKLVLLSNKRGSKIKTINEECSKIEVGSDS
jgi:hypothetical protein